MKKIVGVLGGGLMGAGIAAKFALAGWDTVVVEANQESLPRVTGLVKDVLAELVEAGVITSLTLLGALSRVKATGDYQALKTAAIVIEAIPEIVELKQSAYEQLEAIVNADTIIASNTSGLMPDLLATHMKRKERFLIAHFWNPPHFVPLVEVVPGSATSRDTIERTMAALTAIEAEPVLLDMAIPGFIGNRIQFAVLREALNIVRMGAADAATVDAVMKASLGRRYSMMGPFEGADLGGLNTFLTIATHLMPQLAKDEDVLDILRCHTQQGQFGALTGKGFYKWDQQRHDAIKAKRRLQLSRSRKMETPR